MSTQFLQSILDSALDALIAIDEPGRIVEFNAVAERMFGYDRSDVLGKKMAELIIPHELRDAHHAGMTHYRETGTGPVLNNRIKISAMRSSGENFPIELYIVPFEDDGDTLFTATIRDLTDEVNREQELERLLKEETMLRRELDHRVKNNLAQILVMCRQAMVRSTTDRSCFEDFSNRLMAMASIHDLFSDMKTDGVPMSTLVRKGCEPYMKQVDQLRIEGPELRMLPKTAMTFSVVINELATNAAKHGALRSEHGTISVRWAIGEEIAFVWEEQPQTPIETTVEHSFGFQLLESMIPYELGGTVTTNLETSGLSYHAAIPRNQFEIED